MAYDDDDDLFNHDFDFVDDDDEEGEVEEDSDVEETPKPKPKPRKRPAAGRAKPAKEKEPAKGRGKASGKEKAKAVDEPAEEPAAESPRAPRKGRPPAKRDAGAGGPGVDSAPRLEPTHAPPPPPPAPALEPAPVGYILGDDVPDDDEPDDQALVAPPAGPQADHLIHIYEHGDLKRTIPRKFTDEEAVTFAEEYTRTNKAYGRYAVAMPEDEQPSPTFAGAARG